MPKERQIRSAQRVAVDTIEALYAGRHGGRNWVESRAGKGPTSHFTLPGCRGSLFITGFR